MVNKGWLYGLMVFLAQTCNPYYSANDTRNQYEDEIVFEDQAIDVEEAIEIPADVFDMDEEIEVEPPRPRIGEAPAPPPPPPPPPLPEEEEMIFQIVEDMPRFPGCEQKAIGRNELKKCAQEEMIRFMAENIKYPKIAKENGVEGTVVIQFVVGKNGEIRKAQILRDIGGGCGREALRVVKTMPLWIPGKQRGRPVDVRYTLPVAFKLPKEKINKEPMPAPAPYEPDHEGIYRVAEEMPLFPGCKTKEYVYARDCADAKMLKFIYKNLRYPLEAKQKGVEGNVIISWVVQVDGSVTNIEVIRDLGGGTGAEAIRVIKMMPKWIPGKQGGKDVPVYCLSPIRFSVKK